MEKIVSIGKTSHGKWSYKTVVTYVAGFKKNGTKCWLKDEVIFEATTQAKIERLANEYANVNGLVLMPHIRHYSERS